jgi:DNA-nicking Smr family endonuclease
VNPFLDTVMTKKPTDFDVWAAFIQHLDKPLSSQHKQPSPSSEVLTDTQDWKALTRHMDWVNQHRNAYAQKALPTSIRQKSQLLSTYEPQLFMTSNSEVSILDLDRIDKKQLPKLLSHPMSVIDLHGYTLPLGYERLKAAFSHAIQRKTRLLKVITGKGRPNPEPESPTLRAIFPKWMKEPYFNTNIIKIRKAPKEHGGEGAFLIYLKQTK